MRSRRRVADGDAEKAFCGAMVASIACYMRLGLTVLTSAPESNLERPCKCRCRCALLLAAADVPSHFTDRLSHGHNICLDFPRIKTDPSHACYEVTDLELNRAHPPSRSST
jgi:hypothetical protein